MRRPTRATTPQMLHPRLPGRTVIEVLHFADRSLAKGMDGIFDLPVEDPARAVTALHEWFAAHPTCGFDGNRWRAASVPGGWASDALLVRVLHGITVQLFAGTAAEARAAQRQYVRLVGSFREDVLTERVASLFTVVLVVHLTLDAMGRGEVFQRALGEGEKVKHADAKKARFVLEVTRRRLPRVLGILEGGSARSALRCYRLATAKLNPIEHYAAMSLCRTIVHASWLTLTWRSTPAPDRYRAVESLCRLLDEDDRAPTIGLTVPVVTALHCVRQSVPGGGNGRVQGSEGSRVQGWDGEQAARASHVPAKTLEPLNP